jgi:hypothetical protein
LYNLKYTTKEQWSELHKRWCELAKLINWDGTFSDDANISELIDIEEKIWSCVLDFKEGGIESPKSMKTFKPYVKLLKEMISSSDAGLEDNPRTEFSDRELLNNELAVAQNKVVKYKKMLRYKTGAISDDELEKMADSTRFKSSQLINYKKLGGLLGCSDVTAKNVITERLPYLLEPKDY